MNRVLVFMNYRRLRHLQRCNNFLKVSSEDVAQHSFYTSILAMIIADEMKSKQPDLEIDMEMMFRKSLLHDIDEAITGDVPYNVKEHSKELGLNLNNMLCDIAGKCYLDNVPQIFQEYASLSKHCKDGFEGAIIALADILELSIYAYEEVSMGNKNMSGLLSKCIKIVRTKEIFEKSEFSKKIVEAMLEGSLTDFQFL